MFCIFCGEPAAPAARFCARCGQPIGTDPEATVIGELPPPGENLGAIGPQPEARASPLPHLTPPPPPHGTSSDPIGGGRYATGTIVAERYRIVALLGRGGMGEVYRAEDLRLSQMLAIKFLPERLSADAPALARFHSEVRVARQVSHPNVCRVFDIGDAGGVPFLTMEYIDGEDLSSLVRRIGRLPEDKAVEVSRQICAGLAAAHDQGVVHRDLKPSNVMLDGSGKARITDFGLAAVALSVRGADARAGTPAYMSPEQLEGREVTAKSDLYSLGLLMYELLTGKRAYGSATLPELRKAREAGPPTRPSEILPGLNPLIERVILRCLDPDPERRPSSALQVAAALPGGDPLQAALAAGETPSPEMVAAAGNTEAIRPRLAAACLVTVLAMAALSTYLGVQESGLGEIRPPYSGEVLTHKAQELVRSLGYPDTARDLASGFAYDDDYLDYVERQDGPRPNWSRILQERVPVLRFWFRQSPKQLVPYELWRVSMTPGIVTRYDPAPTFSGMIQVELDPWGRLLYFQAIPPERVDHPGQARDADWQPLFTAAGLDEAVFHSVPPVWNSLASADQRAAWDGLWPGSARTLHVEAAAWQGQPVFFQLSGPWTVARRLPAPPASGLEKAREMFSVTLGVLLIVIGLRLAYRNYRRGKGDRRGALRLAAAVLAVELVLFFVRAHLVFSASSFGLLVMAASTGLFLSALFYILYLALEPYVRRKWPQTIVSWTRLLSGRVRDPLVGRDILFGTVLGLLWVVVYFLGYRFDIRVGQRPQFGSAAILEGARTTASLWLSNVVEAVFGVLSFFFVLVVLRVVVRNRWLAAALFVLLFTTPQLLASAHPWVDLPVWLIIYGIAAFALVRYGLITLAIAVFVANLLLNLPFTLDVHSWYATESLGLLLSMVLLAAWGFHTALAGQRLFERELFEE